MKTVPLTTTVEGQPGHLTRNAYYFGGLEHWRRLVPVGKQMMEGEVERGRDDQRHRLRGQRWHLEHQMQHARYREGYDDAADAGDMEASAPLHPGAAVPRQMAEGNAVVRDKVCQDRDFGRYGKGDDIVYAMREW